MQFNLVEVAALKSEELEPSDLQMWEEEINRRAGLISECGQLLTPLVIYLDGIDDCSKPIYEVEPSDFNLMNFLAIYQLNEQNPGAFEMVNAWICENSSQSENVMEQIDEMSFSIYDK